MATQIKLRRGTEAEHSTFTGALAELTVDTTNKELRLHDGVTQGGKRVAPIGTGSSEIQTNNDNRLEFAAAQYVDDSLAVLGDEVTVERSRIDSSEARLTAAELVNTTQDSEIAALQAGQGAGVIGYATQAELYADLAHAETTVGYVTNDPDSNKNGVYRKVGASGAGSWTQSSGTVPLNSIARTELSKDFSFNGQISAATDLNTLRDNGIYYGAAASGFVNMPPNFDGAFTLDVSEAYDGASNFLMQVMRDFNNQLITWVRRLSGGGSAGDWQREYQNEYMLTKGNLLNNASTQDANEDGIYFLASANTYTDMPVGAPVADYVLSVNEAFFTSKGRFKNQKLSASTSPNLAWVRRVDLLGAATQGWQKATAAPSSVDRSVLSANYADKNTIVSVDADDIQEDGTYLITDPTSIPNLPTGASTGILEVRGANGNNFGFQEYTDLFNANLKQRRMTRPGNSTVSPWMGMAASEKTIACFGDSITENGTYPQELAQMIGGQTLRMGFGGCRMANHESAGYSAMCMNNMSQNIADNDYTSLIAGAETVFTETGDDNRVQAALVASTDWSSVDYAILFWGTNDFAANVPIGTTSDVDGTTFIGAINKTVTNLLSTHSQLKILMVSPFWRPRILSGDGKSSDDFPNTNGDYLIDFVDAIKERSAHYRLDFLDFYREGNIAPLTQYEYLGAGDDIHPKNPEGYTHVAERIAAKMKSSIR